MYKQRKLEQFLENEFLETSNISVLKMTDTSYMLFGKYSIQKNENNYIVKFTHHSDRLVFIELKSAVAWCVYHERGKLPECREIEHLDFKIGSTVNDITQTKSLIEKTKDRELRHIYTTKLEEYILKNQYAISVLNQYVNTANRLHIERLNSAIKR